MKRKIRKVTIAIIKKLKKHSFKTFLRLHFSAVEFIQHLINSSNCFSCIQNYEICDKDSDDDEVWSRSACGLIDKPTDADRSMEIGWETIKYNSSSLSGSSDNDTDGYESEIEDEVQSEDENLELDDDNLWYNELLYENSHTTLGEAVFDVLNIYISNRHTKKSLEEILHTMHKHLPKRNTLPRSKYKLLKLLDKLFVNDKQLVKKFRLCEDCSKLLGDWSLKNKEIICDNCGSRETNGKFFHFEIGVLIKHLLEFRNLGDLLLAHKRETILSDEYVSGNTSGSEFKFLQKEILQNDYDICLLWNIDDTPLKKSSKSHICMLQSQICNIPQKNRRNFQFMSGIYYSRKKTQK